MKNHFTYPSGSQGLKSPAVSLREMYAQAEQPFTTKFLLHGVTFILELVV